MSEDRTYGRGRWIGGGILLTLLLVAMVCILWFAVGRWTAEGRRLVVRQLADTTLPAPAPGDQIRILAWNIAHGRGDERSGLLKNWRGGASGARADRLARMAAVLRRAGADVVILNEVDFDAAWSGSTNQARTLARAAGYPIWVEQRNFDIRLPVKSYAFGNAVLSRFPIQEVRWLNLPAHSRFEALVGGTKSAALIRLETPLGPVAVVPVHLDPRSEATRLAIAPVLDTLRRRESAPIVLGGDFNASPPGWPGAGEETVVGRLLEMGWRSSRTGEVTAGLQATFPTWEPARAIDWVLVEPPLRVEEEWVILDAPELSDHLPVMTVLERTETAGGTK